MKTLVFLLGFFAIAISILADGKGIANKEEYLKAINDLRRDYAKKSGVPNMNKLVWDDYLERLVESGNWPCMDKTCRLNRRDGNDNAERHAQDLIKDLFPHEKRQKLIQDYQKFHMNGNEDLTPGQQKIGCYPRHKSDSDLKEYGTMTWETLCILTPEGNGTSWDMPRGEPGSVCPTDFVNEDGLCAPKSESSGGSAASKQAEGSATTIGTSENSSNNFGFLIISALVMILNFM